MLMAFKEVHSGRELTSSCGVVELPPGYLDNSDSHIQSFQSAMEEYINSPDYWDDLERCAILAGDFDELEAGVLFA